MSDDLLITPVISPSGTVHFASVPHDATIQDIITALSRSEDVREDILLDLPDSGWDIQSVRKEQQGRSWEDTELEELEIGV